jgi:hypothetical protein
MTKENSIVYEGWTHLTEGRDEIEQAFLAAGREQQLRFLPRDQSVSLDM